MIDFTQVESPHKIVEYTSRLVYMAWKFIYSLSIVF